MFVILRCNFSILLTSSRQNGYSCRRETLSIAKYDNVNHIVGLFNDTIRYDSVHLTCSKKLTGSQLSLPHGINKKLKCETKNKMMRVIGPVQSRYREAVR